MTDLKIDEKWWKVSKEEEYKKYTSLKSDVDIIQEWMKKQPHLPPLNDNQIIMFLRACESSLEVTKTSIDLNYTMKTKLPEFFAQRDIHSLRMEVALTFLHLAVLPKPLDDDFVYVIKLQDCDISKFNLDDMVKLCFMIHDVTQVEYGSSGGYIYIVDMIHVTFNIVLRLTPSTIGNMLKFWQDCSTYRIKGFHVVNGGHIFSKILQICKQFMNPELLEVIQVHDDYDSLKKYLNTDFIPSDYGGNGASLEELNEEAVKILKQYKDWFKEEEKQRIDLKRKLFHKSNNYDDGLQGSFRQLNID